MAAGVLGLGIPAPAMAVDGAEAGHFEWSGSLRFRQEVLQDSFRPYPLFNRDQSLFSSRGLLALQWHQGALRLGAEVQDSRAWGARNHDYLTTGEVNALEPVQFYMGWDWSEPFGKGSKASVQAGRFTMNIGSRRLVAADDYRNTTNGYTGMRADFTLASRTQLTAYYTLPQFRRPFSPASLRDNDVKLDKESGYLQLWGVLLSRKDLFDNVSGDVGYVGAVDKDSPSLPTRDRRLHSLTARLYRDPKPGVPDFEIEGISQFGRAHSSVLPNAPWQDVAASAAHAQAGYLFTAKWKPRIALEYAFASGDGPGARDGRFDTLFGMRRVEFGPSGIFAAVGRTNVEALSLRLEATPSPRLDGYLVFRTLWAASGTDFFSTTGVRDPSGQSGTFAGHTLETSVRYWVLPKSLRMDFYGVWLIKRDLLRDAPNAPPWGNTVYGSAAITYTFGAVK
jgi:Alginate export